MQNPDEFIPDGEDLNADPFADDFKPGSDAEASDDNLRTSEVFDAQALMDGPLDNFAMDNAPIPTDETHPRYAMSGLLPVPLYRQNGNNSFGDFNPKNGSGQNTANINYFPPFQLMPLYGGTFPIPYENRPTESEEPLRPEPFDYNAFMRQPKDGITALTRTAKQCADIFMLECRRSGGYVFEALTGFHLSDNDRGLGAARRLMEVILPVADKEIFGVRTEAGLDFEIRIKNGIPFKGPFLDQLLQFVNTQSIPRIQKSGLPAGDREVAMKVAVEVRNLLRTGMQMANTILNESEAEMRDPTEIKKAYDPPNLEIPDAPVSTDSYCLAHTNRIELDDKQLAASENIGKGLSTPMNEAVNRLADIAERMTQPTPAQVPANVMSIEDVQALLDKQAADLTAAFDEKLAAAAAAGSGPADTGAPKEGNTEGAGKTAKGKEGDKPK